MGEPLSQFTAGDRLDAAVLSADLQRARDGKIEIPTAEAIDASSVPKALYISDNGWVGICDGDDVNKIDFIGFAVLGQNVGSGEFIEVMLGQGVLVKGFTSLTRGSKYYVQDDKTLGTSPGTYEILIGIAISATALIIASKLSTALLVYIVSDNLQASADIERSEALTGYVKKKEISVKRFGTIRVDFDLKTSDSGGPYTAMAEIYINGVSVGVTRLSDSLTYVTQTAEDFSVVPGDLIQLYLKIQTSGSSKIAYTQNFRLYWDMIPANSYVIEIN